MSDWFSHHITPKHDLLTAKVLSQDKQLFTETGSWYLIHTHIWCVVRRWDLLLWSLTWAMFVIAPKCDEPEIPAYHHQIIQGITSNIVQISLCFMYCLWVTCEISKVMNHSSQYHIDNLLIVSSLSSCFHNFMCMKIIITMNIDQSNSINCK